MRFMLGGESLLRTLGCILPAERQEVAFRERTSVEAAKAPWA